METYYEEVELPKLAGNQSEVTGQRVFKCDWERVGDFLNELYGGTYMSVNGKLVISGLAFYPGLEWLVFDSFSVSGFHDRFDGVDANGLARSEAGALVEVNYKTQPYDQKDNEDQSRPEQLPAYVTHSVDASFQRLEHPLSGLIWEEADNFNNHHLPADVRPSIPITSIEHTLGLKNRVSPDFRKLNDLCGRCNDTPFLGHEPEQVIMRGFRGNREIIPGGVAKWDIEVFLSARVVADARADGVPIGWNHQLQPNPASSGNRWVRIVYAESGEPLFPRIDMAKVFQITR